MADRRLCADVPWIEEETLSRSRHWRGFGEQDPCLLWRDVSSLAKSRGLKTPHGHFDGEIVKEELGFDPCERAEDLTASHDGAKRNAKRVLNRLTAGARQREDDCWQETRLETLEVRGRNTGLAPYLGEVSELLIPLFRGRRERD